VNSKNTSGLTALSKLHENIKSYVKDKHFYFGSPELIALMYRHFGDESVWNRIAKSRLLATGIFSLLLLLTEFYP
jgi:hypothetical protein